MNGRLAATGVKGGGQEGGDAFCVREFQGIDAFSVRLYFCRAECESDSIPILLEATLFALRRFRESVGADMEGKTPRPGRGVLCPLT
ncbi:unnamed protein product [Leptosia nina]|uniref:Uncharacterized protein n=1 Tax=Leptosia nina TaxID=320188 RepID=A0AAV1IX08_9NEOP